MNKTHFLLIGMVMGLVITKLLNHPITWTNIGYVSVIFIIISIDKLNKVVMWFFIITYLIYTPMTWIHDTMKWYEPLLYLYLFIMLLFSYFPKKRNKPLFVDYGDITRFPPKFKEDIENEKRIEYIVDTIFNINDYKKS